MANRVLCHLRGAAGEIVLGQFHQCLVCSLLDGQKDSDSVLVNCEMVGNKLVVSEAKTGGAILRHPPLCPLQMMTEKDRDELPEDVVSRGINAGVVALVESSDGYVLLTRRAPHMRTFPGVWVPPGGGVDEGESLIQTALRELREETGLVATDGGHHILCLWESCYPPFLEWGTPQRHHVVVYFHIRLSEPHAVLNKRMVLQEEEVDASAWLSRKHVDLVINGGADDQAVEKTFLMRVAGADGTLKEVESPAEILFAKANKDGPEVGRISSGTRFALSQWLDNCSTVSLCKL